MGSTVFRNPLGEIMSFSFKKKKGYGPAPSSFKKELVKIVCPVSYAKVYEPDDFMGEKAWKMNIHPDKANKEILKAAGGQLKPREKDVAGMEDAGIYYSVKRPFFKQTAKGPLYFSGPTITDADGKVIMGYSKELDWGGPENIKAEGVKILIGNGSLCEVTLECYKAGEYGKFFRLESVKILELVEYEEADGPDDEGASLDDDIPFESDKTEATPKPVTKKKSTVEW